MKSLFNLPGTCSWFFFTFFRHLFDFLYIKSSFFPIIKIVYVPLCYLLELFYISTVGTQSAFSYYIYTWTLSFFLFLRKQEDRRSSTLKIKKNHGRFLCPSILL